MSAPNQPVLPSSDVAETALGSNDTLSKMRAQAIAALSPETRQEIGEEALQTMPLAILRGLPEAERYVAALNKAHGSS
mgnify:CR=1 FL=1